MGCDIHMAVEAKQEDGTWKTIIGDVYSSTPESLGKERDWYDSNKGEGFVDRILAQLSLFEYITPKAWQNMEKYPGWPEEKSLHPTIMAYDNRNYDVFAILANVRNGGRFNFISEPRGVLSS